MKLVDEIVEMAVDSRASVADALRKCLVLAFQLKNEKLKAWTEKELNGFDPDDAVPEYRRVTLHSKGNCSGIAGARMTNRPLPMSVLDREHWDLLTSRLIQPIGAYETFRTASPDENPSIPWPPDLIVHYQESFIDGFALHVSLAGTSGLAVGWSLRNG
jgi:AbiTii